MGDSWDREITFLGRADPSLRKSIMMPGDVEVIFLAREVRF